MAQIIKRGTPYKYYDFVCPKCHSIVRFGESELHRYEDCYDTPMVETDNVCPNCLETYIQVPEWELKNHLVGVKPKTVQSKTKTKSMKKKKLNTYYLKKFRRKAANIYRVLRVLDGYQLQKMGAITYGACEYSYSEEVWVDEEFFKDKKDAYKKCDELRRELILKWCREKKEEKIRALQDTY